MACFFKGSQKQSFFLQTLIYGISRDGSKIFNMRTCEHTILGQLGMEARQTKNAPLVLLDLVDLIMIVITIMFKMIVVMITLSCLISWITVMSYFPPSTFRLQR